MSSHTAISTHSQSTNIYQTYMIKLHQVQTEEEHIAIAMLWMFKTCLDTADVQGL